MEFRKTTNADLKAVMAIIEAARQFLKAQGSPQWQNGQGPNEAVIKQDIAAGSSYVLAAGGEILGTVALITGVDPVYTAIAGDWQGFGPYLSLHRVAISGSHRGQGLAGKLLQAAVKEGSLLGYHDFRIDTYPLNERMEKTIFAAGFTYRGMIEFPIPNGTRKAYQLLV